MVKRWINVNGKIKLNPEYKTKAERQAMYKANAEKKREQYNKTALKITRKAQASRYFALDIETQRWSTEKQNLDLIEMIFGVLLPFSDKFVAGVPKIFTRNEVSNVLMSIIDPKRLSTAYVYAHNLDFDFLYVLKDLLELPEQFVIKPVVNGSRIIRVRVYEVKKGVSRIVIEFRNTICLISQSLKKIGHEIGLEKFEHDLKFDIDNLTREDIAYCVRDCEIVVKLLENWCDAMRSLGLDKKIEQITLTASSTAMKLFNNKNSVWDEDSGRYSNPFILNSEGLNTFYRKWYYGGRTEVFSSEMVHNVDYYDYNSMYPATMIQNRFPIPNYYSYYERTEYTFAVEMWVDESNEYIPIFPERLENGLVVFRACKKKVFAFIEEFDYALEQGLPCKPIVYYNCMGWGKPFDYISDLYDLRMRYKREGQSGFSNAIKIIMNSTYGKLGMRNDFEDLSLQSSDAVEDWSQITDTIADTYAMSKKVVGGHVKINVVIAMKITALARLGITKQARELSKNNTIYYMDTDSIVCSHGAIKESNELGRMKIEEKYLMFEAFSAKDYIGITEKDVIRKTKGVKISNNEMFIDYHNLGVLVVRPSKMKELLRLVDAKQISSLEPVQRKFVKKFNTPYTKRYFLPNGSTRPLSVEDVYEDVIENNKRITNKKLDELKEYLNKLEKGVEN